jgi:hypothetical protein
LVANAGERADQVAGFDRPSGAGREDEPGVNPGPAEVGAVRVLVLLAEDERVLGQAGQRQVPVTGSRLDGADVQFALDSLDLLPDADQLGVEVDVLPSQSEGRRAPPNAWIREL